MLQKISDSFLIGLVSGNGFKMKMKKYVFEGVFVVIIKVWDDVFLFYFKIIVNEDMSIVEC